MEKVRPSYGTKTIAKHVKMSSKTRPTRPKDIFGESPGQRADLTSIPAVKYTRFFFIRSSNILPRLNRSLFLGSSFSCKIHSLRKSMLELVREGVVRFLKHFGNAVFIIILILTLIHTAKSRALT